MKFVLNNFLINLKKKKTKIVLNIFLIFNNLKKMAKFDFLFVTVIDVIFYSLMAFMNYEVINKNPNEYDINLTNKVLFYFSSFLVGFSIFTFLVTSCKANYRQIILPYIGIKTFYTTLVLFFFIYTVYVWGTTFQNYDIFTVKYIVKLSILGFFAFLFFILTIRQIVQLRRGEYSAKKIQEEMNDKLETSEIERGIELEA